MDIYDTTIGEKIKNEKGFFFKGQEQVKGYRNQSDGAFEHSISLSHD